jgi:protoheme IX farnesyltransferase
MIELLLLTAIPAMLVAQRGLPSVKVLLVTLTAAALAAGSSNTINSYIDRGTGATDRRSTPRPPSGNDRLLSVIKPAEALTFGIALGAAATLLLGLLANWLSAVLADAAILLFVLICALRLKRWSPSRTVIGGAAGCFPVLIGWSAVTGTLNLLAIVLIAVIFCWMPPRLWALAMEFRRDWPVAQAPTATMAVAAAGARTILWYSCVMVAATLGLAPYGGWIYTACAVALGTWFLAEAHRLRARARVGRMSNSTPVTPGMGAASPMGLSGLSVACLAQLSAAVIMALALLPRGH